MSYDWTKEQKDKDLVPEGFHRLRVEKVVTARGPAETGSKFKSRSGDPQILVVFTDDDYNEATLMLTLSAKAGWTLQRLLSRLGIDLENLNRQGLEPADFARESVHNMMIGRTTWAYIEHEESGGKMYTKVEPKHWEDVPASVRGEAPPQAPTEKPKGRFDEDDIPF